MEIINTTYGWLYQHYVCPLLEEQREKARADIEALCQEYGLNSDQQISLTDQMEGSCSLSGAAAFSIGVYFGMQLLSNPIFSELKESMERYQIEIFFQVKKQFSHPVSGSGASGKTSPHSTKVLPSGHRHKGKRSGFRTESHWFQRVSLPARTRQRQRRKR